MGKCCAAEFAAFMTQPLPQSMTLLHCLRDGQEHLVRPLMALGLSIDVRDSTGSTPLHAAASAGPVSYTHLTLPTIRLV